jgi:hypothetical protein
MLGQSEQLFRNAYVSILAFDSQTCRLEQITLTEFVPYPNFLTVFVLVIVVFAGAILLALAVWLCSRKKQKDRLYEKLPINGSEESEL